MIGAFKSGTTSLVHCLGQHPDIFLPWLQEPNYFGHDQFEPSVGGDPTPRRDRSTVYGRLRTSSGGQYRHLFEDARPDQVTGECSPQYLTRPPACGRIRQMIPDVKLIALLRNPIDRAFSDYSMFVRDGLEDATFAEAVRRPYTVGPPGHYVATGMYGRQLLPYVSAFPEEQLRVLLYDDWVADPQSVLRSLFDWLGVDHGFEPDVSQRFNASGIPATAAVAKAYEAKRRLQPFLKPLVRNRFPQVRHFVMERLERGLSHDGAALDVRRKLAHLYVDDVALLSELLGRDLSHWLVVPDS